MDGRTVITRPCTALAHFDSHFRTGLGQERLEEGHAAVEEGLGLRVHRVRALHEALQQDRGLGKLEWTHLGACMRVRGAGRGWRRLRRKPNKHTDLGLDGGRGGREEGHEPPLLLHAGRLGSLRCVVVERRGGKDRVRSPRQRGGTLTSQAKKPLTHVEGGAARAGVGVRIGLVRVLVRVRVRVRHGRGARGGGPLAEDVEDGDCRERRGEVRCMHDWGAGGWMDGWTTLHTYTNTGAVEREAGEGLLLGRQRRRRRGGEEEVGRGGGGGGGRECKGHGWLAGWLALSLLLRVGCFCLGLGLVR